MATEKYSNITTVDLEDLYYNVELIFDKRSTDAKVIFKGIDPREVLVYSVGKALYIEHTSGLRDVKRDKEAPKHWFSKVSFFGMEGYETPLQQKATFIGTQRRTLRNFVTKRFGFTSFLKPGPAARIIIVAGPVNLKVNDCISVVGVIEGDIQGDVRGSSYLNLDGAKEVELNTTDNAKVRLQGVSKLEMHAAGISNVRVAGDLKRVLLNAYETSRVTLKSETLTDSIIRSGGDAEMHIVGDVTSGSIMAAGHSSIHVVGSCEMSEIVALGTSRVSLTGGSWGNNIKTELLAAVNN